MNPANAQARQMKDEKLQFVRIKAGSQLTIHS